MTVRWDVLGLGAVAVDDLYYLDHHPAPDSKVAVRAHQRAGGGLTGTALVAAARLGASAAYAGVLGSDEFSLYTLRELEREGVDCTPVLRRDGAQPTHSVVLVDRSTGQRAILYDSSGVILRQPEEINEEWVAGCRVLFVDHSLAEGGLWAIALARRLGIPTVADIEREFYPCAIEMLRQVEHLIVSLETARRVSGEEQPEDIVRALAGPERACTVVTAGERGGWYCQRDGAVQHYPAFKVAVVDTTGCGDVFHGAYAAEIARGASVPAAIRVAAAAAAIKATVPGGRAGIPDRDAVGRFLRECELEAQLEIRNGG